MLFAVCVFLALVMVVVGNWSLVAVVVVASFVLVMLVEVAVGVGLFACSLAPVCVC